MAFLSGNMGEPQEPEDECDACWLRIKAAVNCPSGICCDRDGTEQGLDQCWQDAHGPRKPVEELPL
jgi:hypothetical protein